MLTLNDQDRLKSISKAIEKVMAGAVNWKEYREQIDVYYASHDLTYLANKLQVIRTKALASEPIEQHKVARVSGSRFVAGYEELKSPENLYPDYELTVGALIEDLSNTVELFLQEERVVRDWTLKTSKPRYQTTRKITDDERDGLMALIDIKMTIIEERLGIVPETDGTPDDPLDIEYSHRPDWTNSTAEYIELLTADARWARDDILTRYNRGKIDKEQFVKELTDNETVWAAKK